MASNTESVSMALLTIATNQDNDVIMGAIASQITSLTIVYSIVYSDADQRKHQSSASLAFVRGIHRGPVNSPHKWPVTRKRFPFDDVIMLVVNNYIMNYFSKCEMPSPRMFAISVRNYSQIHKYVFKQRMRPIKPGIRRFLSSTIIRMSITVTKYKISKLILDFIKKDQNVKGQVTGASIATHSWRRDRRY